MKTGIVTINEEGRKLAERLVAALPDAEIASCMEKGELPALTEELFSSCRGIVFIMASGIVVRMIAPLIKNKYQDPAVVVVDDAARYAISLLSGHEGGANALAYKVAAALGAEPVITTGTETRKRVTLGIGCKRGVSAGEVLNAIIHAVNEAGIKKADIRTAATIDIKRDEAGLIEGCERYDIPLRFFSKAQINRFHDDFVIRETAYRNLGVRAVSEPCALMAGRNAKLILRRKIYDGITVAAAREEDF